MAQGYNSKLDESLGERRGPERDYSQSMKDRRDESRGSKKKGYGDKSFSIKDGSQAYPVHRMKYCSEELGLGSVKMRKGESRGYPKEAWDYKY